ncbi:MAG: xylose isomerase, partial [Sulfurimonas sp.]|nr:xylose isomerase [Sulfurimonas sp.]
GKKITKENLFDKQKSVERFCDGFKELKSFAADLELYIENNVFSSTNANTYNKDNFFMLTNSKEYKVLTNMLDFRLLLDIAHLKVSSNTLDLNFEDELRHMINVSDYIHISDNDALHDLNHKLDENSTLVKLLKKQNLKNKNYTLEIYDDMESIKETYKILEGVIND